MGKKWLGLVLAVALILLSVSACAEAVTGTAYGVYASEGESPDSLIRVTLTLEDGKIATAKIDEKLIPVSVSGAEGWAELDDETAALVGDAVIEANEKKYPAQFDLGGMTWTGAAEGDLGVSYTAQVDGADVSLMDYIVTADGGEWYFAQTAATLLNAAGEEAAEVPVETKEGIGHGEDFWPSELKYSGNIAAIESYLVASGMDYDLDDLTKGEDGVWTVADAVTGATLAGTVNYLRIALDAYQNAQ